MVAGGRRLTFWDIDGMSDRLAGVLRRQGVARGDILHVAESLFHDHVPANSLGLASCWIHRRHGDEGFGATRPPGTMPKLDFRFESMAALAAAHAAEVGAD